ncbi:IPT/TIG domain-containing protein [Cnuibacter physcomitrellae]|uniref:IPT/TIG domain-containing protein n=1 Tax=Cnuibacter physcomitrellae TaxID=1619308 RepID=UPI002175FF00|nr:IPT/TIG domain-containing protein [Cnuibacter physcomitrellae]MCS5496863.1 IPT/TIG domain-containing protein [Cnuibacter physcomitrellae]
MFGSRWRHVVAPVAFGVTTAMVAFFGGSAAIAAPTDRAEAEGLFLSGGSAAVDLDSVAELAGPYNAYPPGGAEESPLDVTALQAIELGLGVDLFGDNSILTLGAAGQYAETSAAGSFASSGLLGADGAIQAGTGAPGENTTLTLTPVLDAVGADDLISTLTVELGAVSAQAEAVRGATVTPEGDYQIASGDVTLTSPALADLLADLDATLGDTSDTVNALADDGGPIDTTVGGLLGGVTAILDGALPGLVTVDADVSSELDLDLGAALDTVSDDEFVSGPVSVTLSTGTITIDLDELYALNALPEDTTLLSDGAINAQITEALSDILTVQLPTALETALDDVIDSTAIDIDVTGDVDVLGADIGDLVISVDGTVGGLLGNPGTVAPTVSLDGTEILGLDLDDVLEPITDYVVDSILPAVGDLVDAALDPVGLEDAITTIATAAVTALDPLLDVLNTVVQLTVNVKESPGDFRDAAGTDEGSFTQRAVQAVVAPGLAGSLITLNLASATVRALPLAAPSGLAITPVRGPVTGGTPVTITGTNLGDVTDVVFGTVPATGVTLNADGSVSAVAPPQAAPGPVAVTVTNPDGSDSSLTFTYFAVTDVDTIAPDSGSTEGGTDVTITGVCLTGTTQVLFGGVPGTDLVVGSDTTLTVTTPPGTAGDVDVTIVNPTECGGQTVPDGFTYVAPGAPTITGIVPDRGPETGGTTVVLTGTDFTGATEVTFGGVPAADYTVDSDTQITAVTPAHAPGVVDVVVTNPAGDSAGFDFEFFDVADITGVDPDAGPEAGGNTVVITGTCFTGATAVLFGAAPATSFTVDSDTQITAVVPAGTGTVDVTVVGAGDCGTATDDDGYDYVAPPTITGLDPTSGPETGGTVVTITGDGLTGTTGVLFGDVPAASITVVSDTEVQAVTPPHAPATVPVTVQHPGGDVDAGDFVFLDIPTITTITPDQGPEDGGTTVVITGEGFVGATGVTFDGLPGTGFTVDSDTQITVVTPPHAPATVPVVVLHPNGDSPAAEFTYVAGTEIDTVTPPGGPEEGGTVVTITGTCFTGATAVLFGDTPATSFTVDSDTQITAVAPAGTGVVDVTVVGSAACGTDTLPGGYEYTDDPVIGTITPTSGPETGGTVVTITGSNLGGATGVTFDGVPGTGLTIVSDTELTVVTPPGTPGDAAVVVSAPTGDSDPGTFTYTPVTTIDDTDPSTGPTGGGTEVTIVGHCFTGATAVLFGSTPSPAFVVVDDTRIRAVAPAAAAPGAVDVTVVGSAACGDGVLEDGFTYYKGAAVVGDGAGLASTGAAGTAGALGGALLLLAAGTLLWMQRRRRDA